jgi:hypothetical protein
MRFVVKLPLGACPIFASRAGAKTDEANPPNVGFGAISASQANGRKWPVAPIDGDLQFLDRRQPDRANRDRVLPASYSYSVQFRAW